MRSRRRFTPGVDYNFPIFELEEKEFKEGADISRYRSRIQCCYMHDDLAPEVKIAETLYFKGGMMKDFGLQVKEGIDPFMAKHGVMALLKGRDANHIQKEAMAALAIYNWYEKISA